MVLEPCGLATTDISILRAVYDFEARKEGLTQAKAQKRKNCSNCGDKKCRVPPFLPVGGKKAVCVTSEEPEAVCMRDGEWRHMDATLLVPGTAFSSLHVRLYLPSSGSTFAAILAIIRYYFCA